MLVLGETVVHGAMLGDTLGEGAKLVDGVALTGGTRLIEGDVLIDGAADGETLATGDGLVEEVPVGDIDGFIVGDGLGVGVGRVIPSCWNNNRSNCKRNCISSCNSPPRGVACILTEDLSANDCVVAQGLALGDGEILVEGEGLVEVLGEGLTEIVGEMVFDGALDALDGDGLTVTDGLGDVPNIVGDGTPLGCEFEGDGLADGDVAAVGDTPDEGAVEVAAVGDTVEDGVVPVGVPLTVPETVVLGTAVGAGGHGLVV